MRRKSPPVTARRRSGDANLRVRHCPAGGPKLALPHLGPIRAFRQITCKRSCSGPLEAVTKSRSPEITSGLENSLPWRGDFQAISDSDKLRGKPCASDTPLPPSVREILGSQSVACDTLGLPDEEERGAGSKNGTNLHTM
jgi:hypothetical protein